MTVSLETSLSQLPVKHHISVLNRLVEKSGVNSLKRMKPPITGECLCRQVDYVCQKQPIWSVNCHCNACQKLSGAPYVSAFSVPEDGFEIRGNTLSFTRYSATGHLVTTTHCAACGSRIYAQSQGASYLVNIFASTLSNPEIFVAISNVYTSDSAPWADIPTAQFNFPKMPGART